jgi:hypothetical protein
MTDLRSGRHLIMPSKRGLFRTCPLENRVESGLLDLFVPEMGHTGKNTESSHLSHFLLAVGDN